MKKRNKIMVLTFILLSALLCLIACGSKSEAVKLQAPENLQINGITLTWDAVENASGYIVNIDGKDDETPENKYDLSKLNESEKYFIKVKSLGDEKKYKTSDWSKIKEYTVEPIIEQSLEYKITGLYNQFYAVAGIGNVTSDEIVVPSTYNGLPVIRIARKAFENKVNIKKIILPDTIEHIDNFAFAGCTALEYIDLPSSLKYMKQDAFSGSGIRTLDLTDNTALNYFSCLDCPNLESVKLPKNLKWLHPKCFENTPKLKSITLPDSLEGIGWDAFVGSSIESIKIPKKVYYIGESAFENTVINSVEFEEGSELETIGKSAFKGCNNLKSIVIPASVTAVGAYAFENCTNLTSITFEEGSKLEALNSIFQNSGITEFTIPKSATEIAPWVFDGLSSLTKVRFEDDSNVTVLPTQLFNKCYNLITVDFGKNSKIKTIDNWAFRNCVKLTAIDIPQSVTKIGVNAFDKCKAIKSITIPAGVEFVGSQAFGDWTKDQIIYVDGHSKAPDGWNSDWNAKCDATVIWSKV